MHQAFLFLAFCGFAYGAYAVFALGWQSRSLTEQIEREAEDTRKRSVKPGAGGALHRIATPLYWFVTLPLRRPGAALYLAVLMALPALVT